MPDTARSLSDLQTLLANNTTGDIGAQDIRDFLVSAMGGYGAISLAGGVTAQATSTSPAQVSGFTLNGAASSQCTPSNVTDDITLNVGGVWIAVWTCSFVGDTGSPTYTGKITCTGTGTVSAGTWTRKTSNTDTGSAMAIALITGAVATDTVECTIEADAGTPDFTPNEMGLVVLRVA